MLFCTTNMEFRGNAVFLLLLSIASFVDLINSVCIVDKHPKSREFRYHCVGSQDYVSDANRGPIDVPFVTFSSSNIPTIRDAVLNRFAQNLTALEILNSEVKEIEDNAFQGLTELVLINLAGNELEVVKEAWFKGLPNLDFILLSANKIRQIEDGFFSTVTPLKALDISYNKLTCVSESALSTLNVTKIRYEYNPWSWKCLSVIVDWTKEKTTRYDRYSYDGWYLAQNVTKNCIAESPNPQPEDEFINDCVQTAIAQWLPLSKNYTVLQICRMPKRSPFLWCGS